VMVMGFGVGHKAIAACYGAAEGLFPTLQAQGGGNEGQQGQQRWRRQRRPATKAAEGSGGVTKLSLRVRSSRGLISNVAGPGRRQ
jgi:hypothetical protein